MDWKPYITANPEIMHGAVCFRGTRIPVTVVLDNLAGGETAEYILDQYVQTKPYAEYGRSALSASPPVAHTKSHGQPDGVVDNAEEFDEQKYFSEAWTVPELSPGAKWAIELFRSAGS